MSIVIPIALDATAAELLITQIQNQAIQVEQQTDTDASRIQELVMKHMKLDWSMQELGFELTRMVREVVSTMNYFEEELDILNKAQQHKFHAMSEQILLAADRVDDRLFALREESQRVEKRIVLVRQQVAVVEQRIEAAAIATEVIATRVESRRLETQEVDTLVNFLQDRIQMSRQITLDLKNQEIPELDRVQDFLRLKQKKMWFDVNETKLDVKEIENKILTNSAAVAELQVEVAKAQAQTIMTAQRMVTMVGQLGTLMDGQAGYFVRYASLMAQSGMMINHAMKLTAAASGMGWVIPILMASTAALAGVIATVNALENADTANETTGQLNRLASGIEGLS